MNKKESVVANQVFLPVLFFDQNLCTIKTGFVKDKIGCNLQNLLNLLKQLFKKILSTIDSVYITLHPIQSIASKKKFSLCCHELECTD